MRPSRNGNGRELTSVANALHRNAAKPESVDLMCSIGGQLHNTESKKIVVETSRVMNMKRDIVHVTQEIQKIDENEIRAYLDFRFNSDSTVPFEKKEQWRKLVIRVRMAVRKLKAAENPDDLYKLAMANFRTSGTDDLSPEEKQYVTRELKRFRDARERLGRALKELRDLSCELGIELDYSDRGNFSAEQGLLYERALGLMNKRDRDILELLVCKGKTDLAEDFAERVAGLIFAKNKLEFRMELKKLFDMVDLLVSQKGEALNPIDVLWDVGSWWRSDTARVLELVAICRALYKGVLPELTFADFITEPDLERRFEMMRELIGGLKAEIRDLQPGSMEKIMKLGTLACLREMEKDDVLGNLTLERFVLSFLVLKYNEHEGSEEATLAAKFISTAGRSFRVQGIPNLLESVTA